MAKSRTTICKGEYVLVKLPSLGTKIVQMIPDGIINLGKFGNFEVNGVIGHPFGTAFEILEDNKVNVIKSLDEDVEEEATEEEELTKDALTQILSNSAENNQNIINIGSKIQKLSNKEIDELKESGANSNIGQLIIQKMVEGHDGFDKKTIFSQQKYLKRKQQKFLRRFTIDYLGSSQMLQYYNDKDPNKLLDMSEETLGSLMNYSNVRPGGRYLLIDDTGGVILYSMLERMNMTGTVVLIHENEHANISALKHSNYDAEEIDKVVKNINWLQIAEPENEKIHFEEYSEERLAEMKPAKRSQYHKRLKRSQDINNSIDYLQEGNFDGLISVTTLEPSSFLPLVIPKIGGSRPMVIYSHFKEVLLDTFHFLSTDKRVLAPSIFETRVRPYQTILGRIHPVMTMRSCGGYLLVGTRVFPQDYVQAVGRGLKKTKKDTPDPSEEIQQAGV